MAIYYTVNRKDKYHDYYSKEDVVNYILNPEKIPIGCSGFINVDSNNPARSMHECSAAFGKDSGVQIQHFVVSFKHGEIPDVITANSIAKELLFYIGSQYPAIYAVHGNKDNIHFHMAFNNVSINGKRYYGNKAEFFDIINTLKRILRKYGVYVLQRKYYKE